MKNIPTEWIVPVAGLDANSLLKSWRWLVAPAYKPLFATALGDLFLQTPEGRIYWLDVGLGELQEVAPDIMAFEEAVQDPDNNGIWFGPNLVSAIRSSGSVLQKGECYSYLQLPITGGEFMPSNFEICSLETHLNKWGPIQERIRDLPDGSTVSFKVVD